MKAIFVIALCVAVYLAAVFSFSVVTPNEKNDVVQASTPEVPPEKVFQTLADEGHADGSGRRVWFKNTITGECFLSTRMNSGTALAPALCEKK